MSSYAATQMLFPSLETAAEAYAPTSPGVSASQVGFPAHVLGKLPPVPPVFFFPVSSSVPHEQPEYDAAIAIAKSVAMKRKRRASAGSASIDSSTRLAALRRERRCRPWRR